MPAFQAFDVCVIGGGLVGTSVAFGLAALGQKVVLLDEGDTAFRAARGNFALIWSQGKGVGMPEYNELGYRSARRWPQFAAILKDTCGIDVALDQAGGFILALSEAEIAERRSRLARLKAQGNNDPFEIVDRESLLREMPDLGPDVLGGTFGPHDGHVNSLRLFRALHDSFQRRGGRYVPECKVTGIQGSSSGFEITAANRRFRSDKVVIAAGLANRTLAPFVGLSADVRPVKGQMIVTEKLRPFLPRPTLTLRQTDEGGVMIGESTEECGFDTSVRPSLIGTLARRAIRYFPMLRDAQIVRTWAALRVMSRDGFPIYTESCMHPGAFLVTCHSGVSLAAVHALEIAQDVARGALRVGFKAFDSRRFDVQSAA